MIKTYKSAETVGDCAYVADRMVQRYKLGPNEDQNNGVCEAFRDAVWSELDKVLSGCPKDRHEEEIRDTVHHYFQSYYAVNGDQVDVARDEFFDDLHSAPMRITWPLYMSVKTGGKPGVFGRTNLGNIRVIESYIALPDGRKGIVACETGDEELYDAGKECYGNAFHSLASVNMRPVDDSNFKMMINRGVHVQGETALQRNVGDYGTEGAYVGFRSKDGKPCFDFVPHTKNGLELRGKVIIPSSDSKK